MKKKKLAILIIIGIVLIAAIGTGSYVFSRKTKPTKTVTNAVKAVPDKLFGWKFPVAKFPITGTNGKQIAYSSVRDPGGVPQGLPVRLQIPVIGVDSAIEDAAITPDGRMDVPAGTVNVAWFALGPHPGQIGSAVIGGHFGIQNGVPFVFYKLDQVQVGAKVFIIDDKNNTLAFVVKRIQSFDRNADATPVFTSNDGIAHLNLITCEGTWNQVNGNYPLRLVLFTDQVAGEGAVSVNKSLAAVPNAQIAAKATPMPTETLTPTVKPTASPTTTPKKPAATPSPNILVMSAKSSFATPLDGFITSLLLIGIAFVAVKIFRR